jgi:hypothetical protein
VAANIEELPFLSSRLARLDALIALLRELTAEQARLTAARQEVSKQIAELTDEAQKLMTFLDAGVKAHYGNRSEKLTEFGLKPFRSKPRTRRLGPDGQPLKKNATGAKPPASPENE